MKASSFYYGSEVNLETVWLKRIDCMAPYEIENQRADFHGLPQLLTTSTGNNCFPTTGPPEGRDAFLHSALFLQLGSRFCVLRTCTLLPYMTVSESTCEEGSENGDIWALRRESFAQTERITSGSNRSQQIRAPIVSLFSLPSEGGACFFLCLLRMLLWSLQSLVFRGKESVCLFSSVHPPVSHTSSQAFSFCC